MLVLKEEMILVGGVGLEGHLGRLPRVVFESGFWRQRDGDVCPLYPWYFCPVIKF